MGVQSCDGKRAFHVFQRFMWLELVGTRLESLGDFRGTDAVHWDAFSA